MKATNQDITIASFVQKAYDIVNVLHFFNTLEPSVFEVHPMVT
jgi:hypothetical protein